VKFRFLEDITAADAAFTSYGATLEEAFLNGATALMSVMVDGPEKISGNETRKVHLAQNSPDFLFYSFLQEIVYYKDAESLLLLPDDIVIVEAGSGLELTCTLRGEKIDRNKHCFKVDIKAVTMHMLMVEKQGDRFAATAVLDV